MWSRISKSAITVGIVLAIILPFRVCLENIEENQSINSNIESRLRVLEESEKPKNAYNDTKMNDQYLKSKKKIIDRRLRKSLFGKDWKEQSQAKLVLNLFLHFFIMALALCLNMFGIKILHELPFFLFFLSSYYFGLFVNRFGDFYNLSDPVNNLIWTIISLLFALALFTPMRNHDQALAYNIGICLSIVIICIIGLYVFHLEGVKSVAVSFFVSIALATLFITIGLQNMDNLLMMGSAMIGSLVFVTNLQIALEDQSVLTMKDMGFDYFIESPILYFLSVSALFASGFFFQKWQEKRYLGEIENSIAEIRNNITLDLK